MSVEQLSRNANRNLRPDLGGSPTTIHVSPPGTPELPTAPYLVLMHRGGISCEKSGKAAVNFRIQRGGNRGRRWGKQLKSDTGNSLHTQEPVTVASFRTWRGWREYVA